MARMINESKFSHVDICDNGILIETPTNKICISKEDLIRIYNLIFNTNDNQSNGISYESEDGISDASY